MSIQAKKSDIIVRKTHKIDATGKAVGRLASQIAIILRGKNKPSFVFHKDEGDFVEVSNMKDVKITGNKLSQKTYFSTSMRPGGLKKKPMWKVFGKDPGEVLRRAVYNMLPKNKLRKEMVKRLKIVN